MSPRCRVRPSRHLLLPTVVAVARASDGKRLMDPTEAPRLPHYRAIVALDIERSTTRPNPVKGELRNKVYELFEGALRTAGMDQAVPRPVHRPGRRHPGSRPPGRPGTQGPPAEPRRPLAQPAPHRVHQPSAPQPATAAAADPCRRARGGRPLRRQRMLRRGAGRRLPPARRRPGQAGPPGDGRPAGAGHLGGHPQLGRAPRLRRHRRPVLRPLVRVHVAAGVTRAGSASPSRSRGIR